MAVKVLEVHLVGDGVSLDKTLATSAAAATKSANTIEAAGKKIQKTGHSMTSVGKSWNRALTLPLVGIGAVAMKSAFDFERSMSLISTQAGGTKKEVAILEKSVLGLAKSTQWSPDSLAEGLYHIESAGYRSSKAMTILNQAQQLATVGNSNLEETTYALVSAVKALGVEGFGPTRKVAAELNAIVGLGDMRMQELTTSLSSGVISTARSAGVSLRSVGAAMDIMTSRGEPAQIAATRLRMSMSLMSAPTEKAQKALANVGLRTLDLAHTMRKEGLGAAVKELAEHLGTLNKTQANQVLAEAFGGGRSSGAIKALVLNYEELLEKEKLIGQGVRNYSRDVKEAEEQPLVKMKAAWATIQADLVEVGKVVGPPVLNLFEGIASKIDGVVHTFSHLSTGTQGWIVKIGFAVAAMGPMLTIGGKLVSMYGKLFELTGAAAASGVAQDFKAAGALALEGEGMGGFAMAGGSAAKSFMGGIATKLGPLAAAAGLADIVYHAVKGEWKSVGFEVGGALIGGVAGFMLGGPAGAALGAGLGAFGGDIIKGLFGGDNKTKMQEQIVASAHHVAAAFSAQMQATEAISQTQDTYRESIHHVHHALKEVEKAERELAKAREGNGKNSIAVIEAEEKVAAKRHSATMRTREEIEEEETLRFLRQSQGASAAEVIHATGVAIPTERKHIRHLHNIEQQEGHTPELGEREAEASKRLAKYLRDENDAYKLLEKTEPARAKRLKEMTNLQDRYGESGATLKKKLHGLLEEQKEAAVPAAQGGEGAFRVKGAQKVVPSSEKPLRQVQNEIKKTEGLLGHLKFTAPKMTTSNAILGGVQRDLTKELHQIDQQFNRSGPEWGKATVHAMQSSVRAIRHGMKEGVIEAGQGKAEINQLMAEIHLAQGNDPLKLARGFRESWRGAEGINVQSIKKIENQLGTMPKASQEAAAKAMMGMAHTMQQKGKLPEAQVQNLRAALQRLAPGFNKASQNVQEFKGHQEDSGRATEKGTEKLKKFGSAAEGAGHKVQSAKTEVVGGFTQMETKGSSFLQALNVPSPFTGGSKAPKKAGGGLMQVQGHGLHDTVPLYQRDVAAMVAPGEMLAVINRHQAPLMSQALHNEYGVDGLHGFFNNFNKPHNMAIGGVVEPQIGSGGTFRSGGQSEIHTGFEALVKYLKAHSEPERIQAALHWAERVAHQGLPYTYGGGHGALGVGSPGFDCSGYVSGALGEANFIGSPMAVSQGSGLYTLGSPGRGKYLTWGVRGSSGMSAHTMMSIKNLGKGWKYFESGGSGGGPHEDSGWDGSFQLRHMPGFARGGIVPLKAREAVQKYGASATDPNSPHFIGWGFNRGGIATGSRRIPRRASGGWVGTGYTIYTGSGAGAGGNLQSGQPGYAELGTATQSGQATGHGYIAQALGMPGELPMGYQLNVRIGGKEATLAKKDRGYGQGTSAYSIDIHSRAWHELGLGTSNGKGQAQIEPSSGTAGSGSSEKVPGVFHGAHTKSLNFPSIPKTLGGIKREIRRWSREVKAYRRAAKAAKGRTKTQRAIEANIVKIEKFLRELQHAQTKVREALTKKRFSTQLKKAFGYIGNYDKKIQGKQRNYEEAEQEAQQLVALEPQMPSLPSTPNQKKGETDEQYEQLQARVEKAAEQAEKSYQQTYSDYIENQERPAFERVLNIESNLRNTILSGEQTATALERGWEADVRGITKALDFTQRFSDKTERDVAKWRKEHPKKKKLPERLQHEVEERDRLQSEVPIQKFKKHAFEENINTGREAFFGGGKNRLNPPNLPLPGTGSFEDSLIEVQGTHWPGQHTQLEKLPTSPNKGQYGGTIWDTQMAIRELSLKVAEVAGEGSGGGGGGGGGGEGASNATKEAEEQTAAEKLVLVEEMQERERRERAAEQANVSVLAALGQIGPKEVRAAYPWAGRYAKGGPVAALFGENGPEIGIVPEGTNVSTADRTKAMLQPQVSVTNHHYPDHTETEVEVNGEKHEVLVNEVSHTLGHRATHRRGTVSTGKVGTLG